MGYRPADLHETPNALARHYRAFQVDRRLLLSGHSHQAWPDVARAGLEQAWRDAAGSVDHKWALAFDQAKRVKAGYRRWLDDADGCYTLAASTHDLLVRWLSALPLAQRPRLVVTDGEFHSARRQLQRLSETPVEVVWVAAQPAETVGSRLAAAVTDKTAAVLTSTVFYQDGALAGDLASAATACRRHGALLLLDVYHQLGVVPLSLRAADLADAYVVGGGYKYLQLGEGNAFLRRPPTCRLRPLVTGWFAEFGVLDAAPAAGRVRYGADRFAGATYDPVSHYRAEAVMNFFDQHGLVAPFLRRVSLHQIARLRARFDSHDPDPSIITYDRALPADRRAGFLAFRSPHATRFVAELAKRNVWCDARGDILRFGPAPYLTDAQLDDAVEALAEVALAMRVHG